MWDVSLEKPGDVPVTMTMYLPAAPFTVRVAVSEVWVELRLMVVGKMLAVSPDGLIVVIVSVTVPVNPLTADTVMGIEPVVTPTGGTMLQAPHVTVKSLTITFTVTLRDGKPVAEAVTVTV
jgi:hypothetical protein